jgi:hypothetical protein
LLGRPQDLPGAANRLVDLDRHRDRLVVTQRDLEFHLVNVGRDLLEVGLLALADDVEGVADLQVDDLVLRRVVDVILADELQPPFESAW